MSACYGGAINCRCRGFVPHDEAPGVCADCGHDADEHREELAGELPFDVGDMQAMASSVLDAFGVCTGCGAEHEPPRGADCLFCGVVDPVADTIPAPAMEAAE